jgi:hypothetical protein
LLGAVHHSLYPQQQQRKLPVCPSQSAHGPVWNTIWLYNYEVQQEVTWTTEDNYFPLNAYICSERLVEIINASYTCTSTPQSQYCTGIYHVVGLICNQTIWFTDLKGLQKVLKSLLKISSGLNHCVWGKYFSATYLLGLEMNGGRTTIIYERTSVVQVLKRLEQVLTVRWLRPV